MALDTIEQPATFDSLRESLSRQFAEPDYAPPSGLEPDALSAAVASVLAEMAEAPRAIQKARVFETVVTQARIGLDRGDWFADKLQHGGHLRCLQRTWYAEAQAGVIREDASWFHRMTELGTVRGGLDMGHIAPGWGNAFAGGLNGLRDRARRHREHTGDRLTPDQGVFYDAVEIVLDATCRLAARFAALAERAALEDPAFQDRYRALAEVCRRVPAGPPQTFHDALQFSWLMHELIEMEGENVRSMGHFDRVFYPYYRDDVAAGRLTAEQAKELIKHYWFKHFARTQGNRNGKNFVFGGQDADGHPVENELTYLALEAYDEMNVPDPKLSVRYAPGSSERLCRTVADLIRRGRNSFVLMNDVPAVEGLVQMGKTPQDARTYLPTTRLL